MLDARVLGVGLDPLEGGLGADALDLELGHEHGQLAARALREDDGPLGREEAEAREVADVVPVEEHVAARPALPHAEQALAALLEFVGREVRCGRGRIRPVERSDSDPANVFEIIESVLRPAKPSDWSMSRSYGVMRVSSSARSSASRSLSFDHLLKKLLSPMPEVSLISGAPEHSHIAAAPGQTVGVVALEQQLGRAATDAQRVAEAWQRDLAEPREQIPAAVVQRRRDGKSIPDTP